MTFGCLTIILRIQIPNINLHSTTLGLVDESKEQFKTAFLTITFRINFAREAVSLVSSLLELSNKAITALT